MDGFLFINKEKDVTSRTACDQVSRILSTKTVGHVGTLDPFATGLLLVMVGARATRCAQFFDDFSKGYIATLTLGEERDSLDITGNVLNTQEAPSFSKIEVESALKSFLGISKQIPPMTSAVHVNGRKLYQLARQGIEVDRPARDIEIFDIKLLKYENNEITFYSRVSKGTYIRVLGSDIAKKLGTIGYLSKLERVEAGPFNLDSSIKIEEVKEDKIVPIYDVLSKFCSIKEVDDTLSVDIKNGKIKYIDEKYDTKYLLIVEKDKSIVAMYMRNSDNIYEFKRGLFS